MEPRKGAIYCASSLYTLLPQKSPSSSGKSKTGVADMLRWEMKWQTLDSLLVMISGLNKWF